MITAESEPETFCWFCANLNSGDTDVGTKIGSCQGCGDRAGGFASAIEVSDEKMDAAVAIVEQAVREWLNESEAKDKR